MKKTLFYNGIKTVFPQFLKNPSNGIDVNLTQVFAIKKNVI